jgi:hypothetical protein
MSGMSDDDFMNMGAPAAQPANAQAAPSGFSDDDFMNMKPASVSSSTQPAAPQRSTGEELARQAGLTGRILTNAALSIPAGVGDIANTAINAGTGLINKYAGTQIPQLGMPSEDIDKTLTNMGYPEPENRTERNVQRVGNFIGSVGAGSGDEIVSGTKAIANSITPMARQTAQDIRALASSAFEDAKSKNAVLSPEASQNFVNSVEGALLKSGKMNDRLHGDTLSVLNDMKNEVAQNGSLGLDSMYQYRQLFGDAVNNNLHPNGIMKPDAFKADRAIDSIDDFMNGIKDDHLVSGDPSAVDFFNLGRARYAQASRMDDIERIINRAQLTQNPATSMRTGFASLANNPKRMRGFSDEEQGLIRQAATSSLPMEALRTLSGRILNYVGLAHGPAAGLATQVGTAAARNLASDMQAARGNKILDALAQRGMPDFAERASPNPTSPLALPAPADYRVPPGGFGAPQEGQARLTYQPGPDFTATSEGVVEAVPYGMNTQQYGLGDPAGMPYSRGELNAAASHAAREAESYGIGPDGRPLRQLEYKPRVFRATKEGIVDTSGGTPFGDLEGIPLDIPGELNAIRKGPQEHKKGGRVRPRTHAGEVVKKPKSYPALEKMKEKA